MPFFTVGIGAMKVSAVVGLLGALLYALTDSETAAAIAAVGTILAAVIGVMNTWLLSRLQQTAQANQQVVKDTAERVGAIHDTARDSATVIREVTGTERRKGDRSSRSNDPHKKHHSSDKRE